MVWEISRKIPGILETFQGHKIPTKPPISALFRGSITIIKIPCSGPKQNNWTLISWFLYAVFFAITFFYYLLFWPTKKYPSRTINKL
jgi:hypothetical protein